MKSVVVIAAFVGLIVTVVSGYFLIPVLRKLKYGQTILDIGPKWHKNKEGTPTMGGIMFILGVCVAVVSGMIIYNISKSKNAVTAGIENRRLIFGILMALAFAVLGFVDDYVKVVKKRNLGLTARQKMIFQILIAVCYLAALYISGERTTEVWFPFIGSVDFGLFYYLFAVFAIVGFVNAVNLTDGVDGLASSVTLMASIAFMFIAALLEYYEINMFASALAAGCMGFLVYNFHPAKVFMGDTGSMFLGGCIVAIAFGLNKPLLLVFCGIIYLIEAGSVMLQVGYFKLTHGKRIFKMSPIHHHFEMSGWSEEKIVIIFSLITLAGGSVAVLAVAKMLA